MAVVAPVPPSPMASVPVIELADKFNANSVYSIPIPPLLFISTDIVLPDLSIPSPGIT